MDATVTQPAPGTEAPGAPERTRSQRCYTPATDIYETQDAIVVVADMPGVAAGDVAVELEGRTLTITGNPAEARPAGREAVRAEYRPGGYQRVFTLSDAIERDRIEARVRNGVLTLVLPKAAPARARRIEVKAA
jgi:HSP20 family protein